MLCDDAWARDDLDAERFSEVLQTRVIDEVDVLVAGGGASGLVAGMAAARLGTRVLVVERQSVLGGTATTAMVPQWLGFFHGDVQAVRGIPAQLASRVVAAKGSPGFTRYVMAEASTNPLPVVSLPFDPEIVKPVLDSELIASGARVLFHCGVVRPLAEDNVVRGLVVETISGRSAVRARVVIDATGDGAVAARAGAETLGEQEGERRNRQPGTLVFRLSGVEGSRFRALTRTDRRRLALAGVASGGLAWEHLSFCSMPGESDAIGLMTRLSGYDFLDAADASQAEIEGRQQILKTVDFLRREVPGFASCRLASIAARVGVRETRRIVGEMTLTEEDIFTNRHFEDSIALGCGPMDLHDSHGVGVSLSMPPAPFEIPLACMLPKGLEGLIVTGRAVSATRQANGAARHMATAMALGQAAGTLAAVACSTDLLPRAVSSSRVRGTLRAEGALVSIEDTKKPTGEILLPTMFSGAEKRP